MFLNKPVSTITIYQFSNPAISIFDRCLEDIDPDVLGDTDAKTDYGLALLLFGRLDVADDILEKVCNELYET